MQASSLFGVSAYWITVIVAMILCILPLPVGLDSFNPDWVLLVLIYWTLAMPEKTGVFNAWVLGLLVDVLTGRLLGLHALGYALVCYVCITSHKRLRQYPLPQQCLFIFFLLLSSQMLTFWIENIRGSVELSFSFWFPVVTGTLFWPMIYSGLRVVRHWGHLD